MPEPFALPAGSTAIVYCEGQFGEQDGKTANGLVRDSEKYEILSVIDSLRAGVDAGRFLDGTMSESVGAVSDVHKRAGRSTSRTTCGPKMAPSVTGAYSVLKAKTVVES